MDWTSWSPAAQTALAHYHCGNLKRAAEAADAAQNDREADLVGAMACYRAFGIGSTVARTRATLDREPSDVVDRRMRLLARWGEAVLTGDPTGLEREIDDALAAGDTWLAGAALEHLLDVAEMHTRWWVEPRQRTDWEAKWEVGRRAADAYDRAGDRPAAIRVWARLAEQVAGPDFRTIIERLKALSEEALAAEDVPGYARCITAAAALQVRWMIASGRREELSPAIVEQGLFSAKVAHAPAYAGDVFAALALSEPGYYTDAARAYGDAGQLGGAYTAWMGCGDAAARMAQHTTAAQAFFTAMQVADAMHSPFARLWSRAYLSRALMNLGRHMEAFAFAEEALQVDPHQSSQAFLLLNAGMHATLTRDAPEAIRFLERVVILLEQEPAAREALSMALRSLATAYGESQERSGLAGAIATLERACAIDRELGDDGEEAAKLAHLALLFTRTATRFIRSGQAVPQEVRDGAARNIERLREITATHPEDAALQASRLLAEARYEYRFGSAEEMFGKIEAARAAAPTDAQRADMDEWAALLAIDYGVDTRDLGALRRAGAHAEAAYRAAASSPRLDVQVRPAQSSARANALLARFETDPAARGAAAAKARERILEAVELYEHVHRFHRAADPASDMGAQLGLHQASSLAYVLAVQVHVSNGDLADAFEALERFKSVVLAGALAFTTLRPPEGIDPQTLEREQELLRICTVDPSAARRGVARQELNALWNALRTAPGGEAYVSLRRGETISWPDTSRLLEEAERDLGDGRRLAIVEYFVAGDDPLLPAPLYAFILRNGDAQPLPVPIEMPLEQIGEVAVALARGTDPDQWPTLLASLAPLVAPIAEHVRAGDVVCVVPSERLYFLPLHAIPLDGGEPLIARNPIFHAPSVTALRLAIRDRRPQTGFRTASVFGNPTEDLADAEKEAIAIAEKLGAAPKLASRATAEAFVEALRTTDIVHFAGHGYFDGEDPLRSGIVLANEVGLTASTLLTMRDAVADLVVLSGCETGLNMTSTGDEIVGLTRAFLYCGVSTLIQTLWRVADDSTARLMIGFYTNWLTEGMARVDALRAAMLAERAVSAQPFYWAPFTLVGDWR